MSDCMSYPKEPMEFIKGYSFVDRDEVYTNGAELVPLFRVEQMLEHYLKPISDKQEQGLLIELPCKVGDVVYKLYIPHNGTFYETKVTHFEIYQDYIWACFANGKASNTNEFGKTVFLTRSEAEEALAKMGE